MKSIACSGSLASNESAELKCFSTKAKTSDWKFYIFLPFPHKEGPFSETLDTERVICRPLPLSVCLSLSVCLCLSVCLPPECFLLFGLSPSLNVCPPPSPPHPHPPNRGREQQLITPNDRLRLQNPLIQAVITTSGPGGYNTH